MGTVDIEAEMAKMMELKLTEISRKEYGDLIKTGMTLSQATDVISRRGRNKTGGPADSPRKQIRPTTPGMEDEG